MVSTSGECDAPSEDFLLSRVEYRTAKPTDIMQCFELEQASYVPEEAASKNDLRYRQHHAARFFRCAVLQLEDEDHEEDSVIGYICSTRCEPEKDDSYSPTHQSEVSTLIIHSMVVRNEYQHKGIGKCMMQDYIDSIREFNLHAEFPISRVLLFSKERALTFYLDCGFSVMRPSRTMDGREIRYLAEMRIENPSDARRDRIIDESTGGLKCYIVDSFASAPGTGNPAAVVIMPKETNADKMAKWMHTVAAEFNLSETAFCWPCTDRSVSINDEHWNIRYYTPKVEIPLCGHATLASAAVLFQTLNKTNDYRIVFHASEDDLTMELEKSSLEPGVESRTRISMEFPSKPPLELNTHKDKKAIQMMLQAAFSCELYPQYVGVSAIGDVLVELKPDGFRAIGYEQINFKALVEWDGYYRGVIVCCKCDESEPAESGIQPDFLSRFFGPKAGINEDPVTGSAHCVLGPYYARKLGKDMVVGKQTSERGGTVECLVKGDTVRLTGTAITTMSGILWMKKEETACVLKIKRERSSSISDE